MAVIWPRCTAIGFSTMIHDTAKSLMRAAALTLLRWLVIAAVFVQEALSVFLLRPLRWIHARRWLEQIPTFVAGFSLRGVILALAIPLINAEPLKILGVW